MVTVETFRAQVEAFLAANDMAASAFGKAALGDPSFVLELRGGRAPNLKTVERVHAFMSANSRQESAA